MKPNKKFDLGNLYYITGVGWRGMIASDFDMGIIGYRGIGEAVIPLKVINRLGQECFTIELIDLLVECIRYSQEVEFEEVPDINYKELYESSKFI